jgi:prepilin-type N-terminal cleavage/methylation domain-containing protein
MRKGYTLIEIIIVITIIGILTGSGALVFRNANEERKLKKDAEIIEEVLGEAKNNALYRKIPAGYTCTTLNSYGVFFNGPGNTYSFWMDCPPNTPTLKAYALKYTTYRTPINVDCRFTYPNGVSTGCAISLRNNAISKCINISVSTNGTVRIAPAYGC